MMVRKAVVDAKTFSSALDQVSKVLRKSSIPVLAEALVSISDGQCTLTATRYGDISVSKQFPLEATTSPLYSARQRTWRKPPPV